MLALVTTSHRPRRTGCRITSRIRAAKPAITLGSLRPSMTTVNSSPPSRATRSLSLTDALRRSRHLLEQQVAGFVAMGVVDGLEPVQIEQHDRHQLAMPVGARQGLDQIVAKQNPIGEAGQLIELRHLRQSPLGAMALDRIADRPVEQRRGHLALGEIVGGAGPHRLEIDLAIALPGQHDEGCGRSQLDRLAHQLQPVALAQAVVDQVDVVPGLRDHRQRLVPRRHPFQLEGAAEGLRQQLAGQDVVVLVVLDQKDARRDVGAGSRGHDLRLPGQGRRRWDSATLGRSRAPIAVMPSAWSIPAAGTRSRSSTGRAPSGHRPSPRRSPAW